MTTTKPVQRKPIASVSMKRGDKTIFVEWKYSVATRKIKGSDRISCYIPGFNIRYSVMDESQTGEKGKVMMKIFFDHFFIHSKNNIKDFILDMHKRGFRASSNDAYIMKELLKNNYITCLYPQWLVWCQP